MPFFFFIQVYASLEHFLRNNAEQAGTALALSSTGEQRYPTVC
jgi:hypothetical protein